MSRKRRKGSTNPDVGHSILLNTQTLAAAAFDRLVEFNDRVSGREPIDRSEPFDDSELWDG